MKASPEIRILAAAVILGARLLPHDNEIEDSQVRVALGAADKIIDAAIPDEPEESDPVPATEAEPRPLDLTDEERAALPRIGEVDGVEKEGVETQPGEDATIGADDEHGRTPIDLATAEGL